MIFLDSDRLRLIPCTLDMVKALQGRSTDLEKLFGAAVPDDWPQQDVRDALPFFIAALEDNPDTCRWLIWVVVLKAEQTVVGDVGFKGVPRHGAVELGYSILPQYRCRGLASEAAGMLMEWAMKQDQVEKIIARCEVGNRASVRVLEKVGMSTSRMEGNMITWEYPHP